MHIALKIWMSQFITEQTNELKNCRLCIVDADLDAYFITKFISCKRYRIRTLVNCIEWKR